MGRETLRPLEPHHSPGKATPSYYTKNGSSTDLAEVVTRQVVAGRPSPVAGWPDGTASTAYLHRLGLLLLM
jgi:hypothetical protein